METQDCEKTDPVDYDASGHDVWPEHALGGLLSSRGKTPPAEQSTGHQNQKHPVQDQNRPQFKGQTRTKQGSALYNKFSTA